MFDAGPRRQQTSRSPVAGHFVVGPVRHTEAAALEDDLAPCRPRRRDRRARSSTTAAPPGVAGGRPAGQPWTPVAVGRVVDGGPRSALTRSSASPATRRPSSRAPRSDSTPRPRAARPVAGWVARTAARSAAPERPRLTPGRQPLRRVSPVPWSGAPRKPRPGLPHRPPPAGAGSVVNRCGGGWSAVADAPSARGQHGRAAARHPPHGAPRRRRRSPQPREPPTVPPDAWAPPPRCCRTGPNKPGGPEEPPNWSESSVSGGWSPAWTPPRRPSLAHRRSRFSSRGNPPLGALGEQMRRRTPDHIQVTDAKQQFQVCCPSGWSRPSQHCCLECITQSQTVHTGPSGRGVSQTGLTGHKNARPRFLPGEPAPPPRRHAVRWSAHSPSPETTSGNRAPCSGPHRSA